MALFVFIMKKVWRKFSSSSKDIYSTRYKVVFFSQLFNKSITFFIFKRFVLSFLFIFFLLVFLTIEFYSSLDENNAAYRKQVIISKTYQARLKEMSFYASSVLQYGKNYEQVIEKIFSSLAGYEEKDLWPDYEKQDASGENGGIGRISMENIFNPSSWWHFFAANLFSKDAFVTDLDEDLTFLLTSIEQRTVRTRATLEHLRDIDSYFGLRGDLNKDIPNGWPLEKKIGYTTSRYGPRLSPFSDDIQFHEGVDIAAPLGSIIVATADGVVASAGDKEAFGLVVMLRHKYGHRTVYAHNQEILVELGQRVRKGQPIARLGSTGRSTGNHLHYEVRLNGDHVDPWPYVIAKF